MSPTLGNLIARAAAAAGGGGGGSGGHGGAAGGHARTDPKLKAQFEWHNINFSRYCMVTLGALALSVVMYKVLLYSHAQLRLWVCLSSDRQRYFARPQNRWVPWLKKHLLWAPMFSKKHNKEIQISSAINVGTLPTRFQFIFLFGYFGANVLWCTLSIDWKLPASDLCTAIRNRTGIMSVVNMVPLFLFAGRNNPLIKLLGISFDTYNLFHRWFGRIVVLEAMGHTAAYMTNKIRQGGLEAFAESVRTPGGTTQTGFIAVVAFIFLMMHSPSILRHAFYETFLTIHILVAILALVFMSMHLKSYPTWQNFLNAAIILWAFERSARFLRILYRNFTGKVTSATYEALPGDALRVTITMPRPWKFEPGQHAYIYVPKFGLWSSHPFTVAWSESQDELSQSTGDEEKMAMYRQEFYGPQKATMSMIIRRRTGLTDTLYMKAANAPNRTLTTTTLVEGPYGTRHSLDSYGTALLIAGGVGITHQVPYIKHLVRGFAEGTIVTRRVTLVWIIQSPEHLEWIRPWMTEILGMERRREILKIMLFITRPKSTKEIISPSSTVQMYPGKPNIGTLLDTEIEARCGAMAVTVCGSGSLSDDVRAAVRGKVDAVNVDFIEEAFSY